MTQTTTYFRITFEGEYTDIATFPITATNKDTLGLAYGIGSPSTPLVLGSDGAFYGTAGDANGSDGYSIFRLTSSAS